MNRGPGVGEETRRRVMKIIESLDFHPNAAARGLAARRTHTLGFVIPHTGRYTMTSTFWPALLTSITEQAAQRGIAVLLSTASSENNVDSAFRSILKGRRVDGAIIGAEQFGERQLAELLVKSLPFVMVGKTAFLAPYSVDMDNAGGARMAAEHLIHGGHRDIALLAGPSGLPHVQERVRGFSDAMERGGLDPTRVIFCSYQGEEVYEAVKTILHGVSSPTALLVAAGDLVIGVMRACAESGRRIPAEMSLISFDDHPFFEHFTPAVTAVRQPVEEMGREAVNMLFTLMDGGEPEKRTIVLKPNLIVRGSTTVL
jgi:LacI family transcriptional regulator